MKKRLTMEEHEKLGPMLLKIKKYLTELHPVIAEAFPKGSKPVEQLSQLNKYTALFIDTMSMSYLELDKNSEDTYTPYGTDT